MQYRVKQIADNIFIPQCRQYLIFKWEAIDNIDNYVWSTTEKYSYNTTLEQAMGVIVNHKKYLKNKKKYPKYYKVSYKPNTNAN